MKNNVIQKAIELFPTPFYVFDESVLQDTIAHLSDVLLPRASLCYAMKANPFITGLAAKGVSRIEVCSPGEFRVCQELNIPLAQIVVSGVHKDASLMREIVEGDELPCRFTIESEAQYDLLESLAEETKKHIPVLVRLTSGNQFGVDKSVARTLVARAVQNEFVNFCGIQFFSGTQKTSDKKLWRELRRVDAFLEEILDRYGDNVAGMELEFGPGLPVEYFEQDEAAARQSEEAQLKALAKGLSELHFGGEIVLELGRAIAASCGTYVTQVMDTKRNKGQNYAIVDGGMHQLVYYGHAMSLQQPVCTLVPQRHGKPEPWNVYGSLCTTSDALAKQIPLCDVSVGDKLVFHKTGAYCMTEGISLFLSRDLPRVLFADEDGAVYMVRDRVETYSLNTPSL